MIVLVGKSGSGKTKYFKKQHPDGVEKHASSIEELVGHILATDSPFVEEKAPLLINAWFDLDCENLIPYATKDIYI